MLSSWKLHCRRYGRRGGEFNSILLERKAEVGKVYALVEKISACGAVAQDYLLPVRILEP